MANLPRHTLDTLDAFDPYRSALVLGDLLNELPELGGRRFLAHRRPEWLALEDKLCAAGLWERAGIPHAGGEVVVAEPDALMAAARRVDRGAGTVWSADATNGWHGGAEGTRRVRGVGADEHPVHDLVASCRSVRVMPYLEGVPCSIHGIVFPDHVVAVRPVELVVARQGGGRFFYAGCATWFDPPDAVREDMRDAARRLGAVLRQDVAFRGAFTLDGVVTADRFLPTEINPRNGAGLVTIARPLGLPLQLLLDAVVAGIPLDWRPQHLEELLVTSADARRSGGTWRSIEGTLPPVTTRPAAFDGARWQWASDHDAVAATVQVGGAGDGASFVRAGFDADTTPTGPPVAARAAAFWDFADRALGTSIGPLVPAAPAAPAAPSGSR